MSKTKTIRFFQDVFDSPSTRPLLMLWVVGGSSAAMRAAGWINLGVASLIITGALIILVISAFRKEVAEVYNMVDNEFTEVHNLIDGVNDKQINRIIQLTALLVANNIEVPPESQGEPDER